VRNAVSNDVRSGRELEPMLRRELARHAGRNDAIEVSISDPRWRGRNGHVYRVDSPALPAAAALKLCWNWDTRRADEAGARREFEALQKVHGAMGNEGRFGVPVPYLLLQDEAGYLAQCIDGTTVDRYLLLPSETRAARVEVIRDAAAWLRRFHDAKSGSTGRVDTEDQLLDLEHVLTRSLGRRDAAVIDAMDVLRRTSDRIGMLAVPTSWAHGDFKPANVMMAGERRVGIDVAGDLVNVVAFDLAYFLNALALAPMPWSGRHLRADFECFEAAFLESYGIEPESEIDAVIAWLRMSLLLSGWAKRDGLAAGLWRRLRARDLRRICARLSQKVARAVAS